jgi:hypothetical protein
VDDEEGSDWSPHPALIAIAPPVKATDTSSMKERVRIQRL